MEADAILNLQNMTYEAGTILELSDSCDNILSFFYFRKAEGISIDKAADEFPYRYELFDIALKKLEADGFISITKAKPNDIARITPSGEIFYRTNSYAKIKKQETSKNRKEYFELFKGVMQIVTPLGALALGIWTLIINITLNESKQKVQQLQIELDSLKEKNNIQKESNSHLNKIFDTTSNKKESIKKR